MKLITEKRKFKHDDSSHCMRLQFVVPPFYFTYLGQQWKQSTFYSWNNRRKQVAARWKKVFQVRAAYNKTLRPRRLN